MNYSAQRTVLRAGSIVFGLSALFLLLLPALFREAVIGLAVVYL